MKKNTLKIFAAIFAAAAVATSVTGCTHCNGCDDYPVVFAHRGCWLGDIQTPNSVQEYYVPENSIDGVKMAVRMGYPTIELDARWTADSMLVCMHDKAINRTMRLADGYAEIPEPVTVSGSTFEDLRTGYVLTSCDPEMRRPIPTLEEILNACAEYGIKPLMHCDIYEGYELAKTILGDNFICFTTNFDVCMRTRAISPCLVLLDPGKELQVRGLETTPGNVLALLDEIGGETGISSMKYSMCDKEMIDALHAHGHVVQSSIFPTPHEMMATHNGADILLSDFCWRPAKDMKPVRFAKITATAGNTAEASYDAYELGAMTLVITGHGKCTVTVNEGRVYEIGAEEGKTVTEKLSFRFWRTAPKVSVTAAEDSEFKTKISIYEL